MSKIRDPLIDQETRKFYEGGDGETAKADTSQQETLKGGWTTEQLQQISAFENQHADGDKARKSNNIIVETFGGIDNLIAGLESDATKGIDPSTVERRQRCHGENAFKPPYIKSLWELIMENFDDPINVILCVAAVVSIIIGIITEGFPQGLTEGVSIIVALVIIFVVNSANNYSSERQLAQMIVTSQEKQITVWRGKADPPEIIPNNQLVVGDIYGFDFGMKFPADSVIIQASDVATNEVDLTGESDQMQKVVITEENYEKKVYSGVLLAKSECINGSGRAIVTAVGLNTAAGSIDKPEPPQETDLQKKLAIIAEKIGWVGIGAAVLTFISMIIRSILEMCEVLPCGCGNVMSCLPDKQCTPLDFSFTVQNRLWFNLLNCLIIAISIIVCAIPEGLPLAVTISLSFSSKQMEKLNNLVRNMNSSETMGSATFICSDKTGTLTQNKMTVMACMIGGKAHTIPHQRDMDELVGKIKEHAQSLTIQDNSEMNVWDFIYNSVIWNSTAFLTKLDAEMKRKNPETYKNKEVGGWITLGNITEQALINFFVKAGSAEECNDHKKALSDTKITSFQFNAERKKASVIVKTDGGYRCYCKGAPDVLMASTNWIIASDGQQLPIEDQMAVNPSLLRPGEEQAMESGIGLLNRAISLFASKAFRTILMAYRDFTEEEYEELKSQNNDFEKEEDRACLEEDLCAVGIWGIQDPLREDIEEAIQKCKTAGIKVIMCTGDNLETAIAISKHAGIVTEEEASNEYACTTGQKFRDKVGKKLLQVENEKKKIVEKVQNAKEFAKYHKNLRVIARCSPEDKKILVTGLQGCEEVVAVTGDGTNDAPALRRADVGFSMGITGTDVAQAASDIILLDDNFGSIVVALKFGRNVYDSVRKFLQFQLAVNVSAMAIVFFGSAILSDSPLNAVQLLWVNLVMDTFGALALATEPPMETILQREPTKKAASIVNEVMWRNIFGHAIFQVIVLSVVIFAAPGRMTENYWQACLTPVEDITECRDWNPFYTNELYENVRSRKAWADRDINVDHYHKGLIKDYNCIFHEESRGQDWDQATCDKWWEKIKTNKAEILTPDQAPEYEHTQKMLHYTLIFQVFVFMQIFNLINSRKIEKHEINVFKDFFNNKWFFVIFFISIIIQCTMVELGGLAVKTYALDLKQNLICLAIGFFELIWGFILKLMPLSWFQCVDLTADIEDDDEEEGAEAKAPSGPLALKRSSKQKSKPPAEK